MILTGFYSRLHSFYNSLLWLGVSFPASISFTKNLIKATAKFKIDRTKWGIKFDSGSFFSDLGDSAVSDAIGIELNIVAVK